MPEMVSATEEEVHDTPVRRQIREQDEQGLLDYLNSLQSETPIKVTVERLQPKTHQGRNIAGTLESYEESISEEDIKEYFGGGKYKLVIRTPDAKGSWRYAAARTIQIAGDPKVDNLIDTSSSMQSPDAVKAAMRMSESMAERALRRADEERERAMAGSKDSSLEFVMAEMAALREQMASKDERIFELVTKKPESSAAELLLGKAIEGESARITAMRSQIDSELRIKNEMHKAEIDRLHDRYEAIAARQDDAHKREIANLERTFASQMESLKTAHNSVVEGYKREIVHLDRQLTVAQTEVAELRARKDKGLVESMTEMAAVKEAIDAFSGRDDDDKPSSTWERIANTVMGSPLAEGVAARLSGGVTNEAVMAAANSRPEADEEPEIPLNRPVQLPDGRIIVRQADGTILQLRTKRAPAVPVPDPNADPTEAIVTDEEMTRAIQFMESALAGDTDPGDFARAARNLVPSLTSGPLQELLKTQGVDAFLVRVAKLSPGSSLLSQAGKNWTRKVAAALLES